MKHHFENFSKHGVLQSMSIPAFWDASILVVKENDNMAGSSVLDSGCRVLSLILLISAVSCSIFYVDWALCTQISNASD